MLNFEVCERKSISSKINLNLKITLIEIQWYLKPYY